VVTPAPRQEPVVVATTAPPVMATPVSLSAPPPAMANIATAQSGSVPFGDIKSPPFGGPMQVAVIQFGRSSSGLGGNDYDVLARVAEIQRRNGGTIRIVAHADQDAYGASAAQIERGNFDVSRRRALAVAQQLRALGVPKDRIVAEAASDDEPIYQTSTARGIAANRRAEVFIDF
jgi:outer membrane protein OmpA-like peptidoglycan-associated protein